jgi:hypothetical protein
MKNLETEAIPQLLSIIPDHPATAIIQFSQKADDVAHAIKNLALEKKYEFVLNITEPNFLEESKSLAQTGVCTVKSIKWEQRRYASVGTLYYNVFVTSFVPNEQKENFLHNVLHHIKTAGHIIIFLPKDDRDTLDEWWALLEELGLMAISTLDISSNYTILVGKKMHGWDSSFK